MGLMLVGFELGMRVGRGALRLLERPKRFSRCLIAERGMRPRRVVICDPVAEHLAGVVEAVEKAFVQ